MKYFPQMVIGGETYKVKDEDARAKIEAMDQPLQRFTITGPVMNLTQMSCNSGDRIYIVPVSASTQRIKSLRVIGKYVEGGSNLYDLLAENLFFGEAMYIRAKRGYDSIQLTINPWDAQSTESFTVDAGVFIPFDLGKLDHDTAENNLKMFDSMRRYFAGSNGNSVIIYGPFAQGKDVLVRFVRGTAAANLTHLIVRGAYYDNNNELQTETIIERALPGELSGATLKRDYNQISIVGLPIVSDQTKYGFVFDFQCTDASTTRDLFYLMGEKKKNSEPFTLNQYVVSPSVNKMKMAIPHAKRNYTVSFDADIASDTFGDVVLYLGTNPEGETVEKETFSKLTVTGTKLIVEYSITSVSSETVEYEHGLTLSGRVAFLIHVKEEGNAEIILSSPGAGTATGTGLFRVQNVPWNECIGFRAYYPSETLIPCLTVGATNGVFHNCILKVDAKDYERKIWAFGDSYFDLWPEYVIAYGYDDMALDGFGGRQGWEGWKSLELEAEKRTPKKIFWALGMNGGDTKGTGGDPDVVNAGWLASFNNVKNYCEKNDVELIVSTIPTTPDPARYHEVKNAIIRASGCRVVDVAAAVGSNAETNYEWFPGLLGNDQIHPSLLGRQIIAAKVMTDIPELAEL